IDVAEAPRGRPAGMSPAEAGLAIEQLVYTAQAIYGQGRVPVELTLDGERTDQILGIPVSEPLANGPVLDTLALVSITTPTEGMQVDNDEPLVVQGAGNSFEGNIVTRIQRWEGTYIVDQLPAIAGWGEDRLFPFEVTFDLTDVPPGDYLVVSSTDDPSGQGREHTDSRRITVVE
ncbi:Gmad2 immunoglobulin-like domain-containing protein, partial [Nocardioides sp.]|uniref:Gmad2 immunoglobulin-like domain-containing protein n=1 Tax=Nocardioides sp. TaxID=35761 RepID=UPI00286E5F64